MGFFSKMFGLDKPEQPAPAAPAKDSKSQSAAPPASTPSPATAPKAAPATAPAAKGPSAPAGAPKTPAAPAQAKAPQPAPAPPAPAAKPTGEMVGLSLKVIIGKFPDVLKPLVTNQPDASVTTSISVDEIARQLPSGAVKIPYGTLRASSPGTFSDDRTHDEEPVIIPLPEILSKVKPEFLKLRPNQKKIEVPDDVTGLFDKGGGAPPKPAAAPAAPAAPAPAAPAPAAPAGPIAMSPAMRDALTVAAKPAPAAPAAPAQAAPVPTPVAPGAPAPSTPGDGGVINVPCTAVSAGWPDPIKQEVSKLGGDVSIELPGDEIGHFLKTGKVTYTWGKLRLKLRPNPISAASANDETVVTLPLSVIAPLYMARHKPGAAQKKVTVSDSIPDTFFGKQGAAAPAAPAVEAPAPAAPAPAPAAPKVEASAAELVQKCCQLPGVAGALIALKEGMPVAQKLPANLKGDTLAAFLPQIFARMSQYTTEMSLGDLENLTFTAGGVPWQVIKAGNVYFAALGRAGEALPAAQLNAIAAELGRQNKK